MDSDSWPCKWVVLVTSPYGKDSAVPIPNNRSQQETANCIIVVVIYEIWLPPNREMLAVVKVWKSLKLIPIKQSFFAGQFFILHVLCAKRSPSFSITELLEACNPSQIQDSQKKASSSAVSSNTRVNHCGHATLTLKSHFPSWGHCQVLEFHLEGRPVLRPDPTLIYLTYIRNWREPVQIPDIDWIIERPPAAPNGITSKEGRQRELEREREKRGVCRDVS